MRGKNYTFFVAGLVGFIGLACYPIIIEPMLNSDKYSELSLSPSPVQHLIYIDSPFPEKQQQINRAGVVQEDIQPGSEYLSYNIELNANNSSAIISFQT